LIEDYIIAGSGRVGRLATSCDLLGVMQAPVTPIPWLLLPKGPDGSMRPAQWGLMDVGFPSGGRGSTTLAGGTDEARKGAVVPGHQRSLVYGLSEVRVYPLGRQAME